MPDANRRYKFLLDSADMVCKPNAVGVSRLLNYVRSNGHEITTDAGEADFIIVNTCGYNEWCVRTSCDVFAEHFAKRKAGAKVISVGCLNLIDRDVLERSFPDLEIVDDFGRIDELVQAAAPYGGLKESFFDQSLLELIPDRYQRPWLREVAGGGYALLARLTRGSASEEATRLHLPQIIDEIQRSNKSYVLIGRGCMNHCSYCIIKKAQGEPRSRPPEDILADIAKTGVTGREGHSLVLVADDCASYGVDIGETFLGLLDRIGERFPGLPVDISYVNPAWIQRNFEEYLETLGRARIGSINLSLQSGSDRILGLMNRQYEAGVIVDFIDRFKRVSPGTMIWTHVIVGFPTETWSDFAATQRALDHFHYFNVFTFSAREGTPAAKAKGRLPGPVILARRWLAYERLMRRTGLSVLRSALP